MRRHLPSLVALQCFEASARHLSFTRAGEELHLTQSAVSRQVKNLEAFLGCLLFERIKQRLQLTAVGAAYADDIRQLLDRAEQVTKQVMQKPSGPLRLATEPAIASRWLIPRLADFRQQHPGVDIELITDMARAYGESHNYDLAILFGSGHWPGLVTRRLMKETLLAVCSPALLAKGEACSDYGDICHLPVLHQSGKLSGSYEWFSRAGFNSEQIRQLPGQRFEYFQLLLEAALQGLGVAVLPTYFVQAELDSGRLVKACTQGMVSEQAYFVTVPKEKSDQRPIKLLVEWLLGQTK